MLFCESVIMLSWLVYQRPVHLILCLYSIGGNQGYLYLKVYVYTIMFGSVYDVHSSLSEVYVCVISINECLMYSVVSPPSTTSFSLPIVQKQVK